MVFIYKLDKDCYNIQTAIHEKKTSGKAPYIFSYEALRKAAGCSPAKTLCLKYDSKDEVDTN